MYAYIILYIFIYYYYAVVGSAISAQIHTNYVSKIRQFFDDETTI